MHLIHVELHEELKQKGFNLTPDDMGEKIATRGIDLLSLPTDTKLHIGESAVIKITGLRNPCAQLNAFQPGLMSAVFDKDEEGNIVRKAGVMSIVLSSGRVGTGDRISIEFPPKPYKSLERV